MILHELFCLCMKGKTYTNGCFDFVLLWYRGCLCLKSEITWLHADVTWSWHPASYTVWSVPFSVACRTGIGSSLYNASLKMFSLFLPYADQWGSRGWFSGCQVSWRALAELEVFQTCCRKRSSGFHGSGMLLQASQGWLLYCSLPEGMVHTSCFGSCLPSFAPPNTM